MINIADFLDIIEGQKDQGSNPSVFLIGKISSTYFSGRPQVQFDGESSASGRTYPYLSSYTPVANDRVLLGIVGHGAVILGKII